MTHIKHSKKLDARRGNITRRVVQKAPDGSAGEGRSVHAIGARQGARSEKHSCGLDLLANNTPQRGRLARHLLGHDAGWLFAICIDADNFKAAQVSTVEAGPLMPDKQVNVLHQAASAAGLRLRAFGDGNAASMRNSVSKLGDTLPLLYLSIDRRVTPMRSAA